MITYTVHLQPYRPLWWGAQPLTRESLARALACAAIRQLETDPNGRVMVDLAMSRPTHEDALNEIAFAAQNLGYSIVQITVTEWANSLVEGLLTGALGFGGIGSTTKDSGFAFLTAVIGAIIGAAVGSSIQRREVIYKVTRTYTGWRFTPVEPQTVQAPRPGLA